MFESWVDEAQRLFKDLAAGDEVRRFLFAKIVERIAPSTDVDAFQRVAKQCIEEAFTQIKAGKLIQPPDWIMVISALLTVSDAFDHQEVLQDPLNFAHCCRLIDTLRAHR